MSFARQVLADPMLRMLAVAVALAAFVPIGAAERPIAEALANLAVFTLFLLNGMRVARSEIRAGLINARFIVPLTLWVFGAMALAGMGLAMLGAGWLPPLIALGFLYLGALPSTVQSATSYTALAGGNIGLSVIGAALLNILGVFVTVPIFLALGGSGAGDHRRPRRALRRRHRPADRALGRAPLRGPPPGGRQGLLELRRGIQQRFLQ